jgi:AraC-like DNA-binding protein
MGTLFIIGIFLSFFLQFLLLTKKDKDTSDQILSVWMFIIGIHLFSYYIYSLGYWEKYPHLVGITHPVPLLHGPMLYLYVAFSLRKDQHFRWKDYLHFLPFVLSYIYMLLFFFFIPAERKVLINHNEVDDSLVFTSLSLVAFIVSGITYPILAYRLLGKHRRLISQNFSYDEKINLKWLRYCIWGIWAIFATAAIVTFLKEVLGYSFGFNSDFLFFTEIILFVFLFGYFGIKHQGLFAEKAAQDIQMVEIDDKPIGEYRKSGLKQEDAAMLHQQLLCMMKEQKPYLESKLTLSSLASELNIAANHLSQIINQYQGQNFYDFVNRYRVEEFKERVLQPQNRPFNILAVAIDSGFNSKSAFNLVFKNHTGKTPSQYMAEIS